MSRTRYFDQCPGSGFTLVSFHVLWLMFKVRYFDQCSGPGTLANVQGQGLRSKSIFRTRYLGQCSRLGTLANVRDQVPWSMFKARHFSQYLGPSTFANVQGQVPWSMPRARDVDHCQYSRPDILIYFKLGSIGLKTLSQERITINEMSYFTPSYRLETKSKISFFSFSSISRKLSDFPLKTKFYCYI